MSRPEGEAEYNITLNGDALRDASHYSGDAALAAWAEGYASAFGGRFFTSRVRAEKALSGALESGSANFGEVRDGQR